MLNSREIRSITISIHALLAESDQRQIEFERYSDISIHALLAESDQRQIEFERYSDISIHALLAESDSASWAHHRV